MICREREGRRRDFAGAIMLGFALVSVINNLVQRLGSLDRGAADALVTGLVVLLQADLREVCSGLVVLILCPTFEGVVVALVAVEPSSEKQLSSILHNLRWLTEHLVVGGWRIDLVGAARGDDFTCKLIVWCVAGDFSTNPVSKIR